LKFYNEYIDNLTTVATLKETITGATHPTARNYEAGQEEDEWKMENCGGMGGRGGVIFGSRGPMAK